MTFDVINNIIYAIFIIEIIMKIIVHGLYFNGPKSYLKSSWNKFGFLFLLILLFIKILSHF